MNRLFLTSLLLFCAIVLISFLSCSQESLESNSKSVELIQKIGPASVMAIRQADRAQLIARENNLIVHLTAEQWSHLQKTLLDDESYIFDLQKRCPFFPDYTLRLESGKNFTDFRISLSCSKIEFAGPVLIDCDPMISEIKGLIENHK